MATYTLGEMVYKITADQSGFNKSIKSSESGISSFASTIKNVLIGGALALLTKSLIISASNAEETANKFGVVFAGVTDAANEASSALVKGFGLSTQEAKELLSTSGNIFQSMGMNKSASLALSDAVTTLAADYVSFTNYSGGVSGASDAIVKAMNGEREALKGLGVAINETDMQEFARANGLVWENMDKASKAALTYEAILSKSKNVVGDFARSQDSFANQSRVLKGRLDDLKVSLGEELLPAATSVVSAFSGIVAAFNELDPATKSAIVEMATFGTILGAAAKAAPSLVSGFSNMSTFFRNLPAMVNPASAAVVGIGVVIYGLAKALEAAGEKYSTLENKVSSGTWAKKSTKDLYELRASTDAGLSDIQKRIDQASGALSGMSKSHSEYKRLTQDRIELEQNYTNMLNNRGEIDAEIRRRETKGSKTTQTNLDSEISKLKQMGSASKGAADEATYSTDAYAGAVFSLSNALTEAADKGREAWDDLTPLGKLQAMTGAISDFGNNISNMISSVSDLYAAQNDAALASLEIQRNAALEAAGVAEDTAVEKAQKEYDAAVAAGDAETILEKEKALKRAKINEDYDKKKSKMEYEAALRSWELQKTMAAIQVVTAPLNAYVSSLTAPWPLNMILAPVNAALALATAGIQFAAVVAAKPQAGSYAQGGIVPGSSYAGDNLSANVNSGEMILTRAQQKNLFDSTNGGAGGGLTIYAVLDGIKEKLYEGAYNASKNGILTIHAGAVVTR